MQLDLFTEPLSEIDILRDQLTKVNDSLHKIRRGLFKRSTHIEKCYLDILERLENMESENTRLKKENDLLNTKLANIDEIVLTLTHYLTLTEVSA